MATISGSVQIYNISDADMVKIFTFKEKDSTSFTFELSTMGISGSHTPPQISLTWTTLEGAEKVVELMKELQPHT